MQNIPTNRPLTHDMLVGTIDRLGGRCIRAEITRLENETFYATLVADQGGQQLEIDCRPSDAIEAATAEQAGSEAAIAEGSVAGTADENADAAPADELAATVRYWPSTEPLA